jgi:hypothetical protein
MNGKNVFVFSNTEPRIILYFRKFKIGKKREIVICSKFETTLYSQRMLSKKVFLVLILKNFFENLSKFLEKG